MEQGTRRGQNFGRRTAAYILDWLASAALGCLLIFITASVLLLASNLNRREIPSRAVYGALAILAIWPPLWVTYTSLSWYWRGATVGMSKFHIAVVDCAGSSPGLVRAIWRTVALAFFSAPLLLAPVLAITVAAVGRVGPLYPYLAGFAYVVLAAFGFGVGVLSPDGRTLLDRISGTWVVCRPERAESH